MSFFSTCPFFHAYAHVRSDVLSALFSIHACTSEQIYGAQYADHNANSMRMYARFFFFAVAAAVVVEI